MWFITALMIVVVVLLVAVVAILVVVFRGRLSRPYSPNCLEAEFSEVRPSPREEARTLLVARRAGY